MAKSLGWFCSKMCLQTARRFYKIAPKSPVLRKKADNDIPHVENGCARTDAPKPSINDTRVVVVFFHLPRVFDS